MQSGSINLTNLYSLHVRAYMFLYMAVDHLYGTSLRHGQFVCSVTMDYFKWCDSVPSKIRFHSNSLEAHSCPKKLYIPKQRQYLSDVPSNFQIIQQTTF